MAWWETESHQEDKRGLGARRKIIWQQYDLDQWMNLRRNREMQQQTVWMPPIGGLIQEKRKQIILCKSIIMKVCDFLRVSMKTCPIKIVPKNNKSSIKQVQDPGTPFVPVKTSNKCPCYSVKTNLARSPIRRRAERVKKKCIQVHAISSQWKAAQWSTLHIITHHYTSLHIITHHYTSLHIITHHTLYAVVPRSLGHLPLSRTFRLSPLWRCSCTSAIPWYLWFSFHLKD